MFWLALILHLAPMLQVYIEADIDAPLISFLSNVSFFQSYCFFLSDISSASLSCSLSRIYQRLPTALHQCPRHTSITTASYTAILIFLNHLQFNIVSAVSPGTVEADAFFSIEYWYSSLATKAFLLVFSALSSYKKMPEWSSFYLNRY